MNKSNWTVKKIGEAAGLRGVPAVEALANACEVKRRRAWGWWYEDKKPEYPEAETLKSYLRGLVQVQVTNLTLRKELLDAIAGLFLNGRRAA